jgi:hypothetical protein
MNFVFHTSSIIKHICRKHDSIDSSFPEIVTARSVDVGNISEATCTDAPVVYKRKKKVCSSFKTLE